MSTKYDRNFTNFQNISVNGSGTLVPTNVGMIEMAQGVTNAASTLSISMISGSTNGSDNGSVEAPYLHISNAGLSLGTGFFRMVSTNARGTLAFGSTAESSYAWKLPSKSGGVGITGTFAVTLQAVTSWAETAVTVSGIRREDAVICQIQDMAGTVTTGRTFPLIAGCRPENGYVYLTFYNPTGTATLYSPMVLAYTAFR